jgi:15-cis-phytoene synthase
MKCANGFGTKVVENESSGMKMDRALQTSYEFCGALARREARNFYCAFLLLPAPQRRSMCALYAFLRHTDDLADEALSASDKALALDAWRRDLDRALAGLGTAWPGFPALAETVARHAIPPDLLMKAIDGVSMDIEPHRFATFDDLTDYCYHVASVVGLSCLHIWGYRSDGGKAERLAESCGIALQLTNIIRDVREDACNGRIYLPEEDLERFGVREDELAAEGRPSLQLRELLAFEGQRAYENYQHANRLVPLVEPVGRPVLKTIVGIYSALLDEIARREYDLLHGRICVPSWRKFAIALRAMASRIREDNAIMGERVSLQ